MNITKKRLKQIIKEELENILGEEDRMAREPQWLAAQDIPAHPRSGFKSWAHYGAQGRNICSTC